MTYEHIDIARACSLARELADDLAAALRFIEDFIVGWERRRSRVLHGIGSPTIDDALAALLSLSTTSEMVGARALSAAARDLHAASRSLGRIPVPEAEELERIGAASCVELGQLVERWRSRLADA